MRLVSCFRKFAHCTLFSLQCFSEVHVHPRYHKRSVSEQGHSLRYVKSSQPHRRHHQQLLRGETRDSSCRQLQAVRESTVRSSVAIIPDPHLYDYPHTQSVGVTCANNLALIILMKPPAGTSEPLCCLKIVSVRLAQFYKPGFDFRISTASGWWRSWRRTSDDATSCAR